MKRTNHNSVKAQQLIDAADMLFKKFGFKRVSVEEICKTAQVSKMTYYKYFKNKQALVLLILDRLFDLYMDRYEQIMNEPISFAARIEKFVEYKLSLLNHSGTQFLKDLMEADEEIKSLAQKHQKHVMDLTAQLFQQAKHSHEIRDEFTLELWMLSISHINQMITDPLLLDHFKGDFKALSRFANRLFMYGYIGRT